MRDTQIVKKVEIPEKIKGKYSYNPEILRLYQVVKYVTHYIKENIGSKLGSDIEFIKRDIQERENLLKDLRSITPETCKKQTAYLANKLDLESSLTSQKKDLTKIRTLEQEINKRGQELFREQAPKSRGKRKILPLCFLMDNGCNSITAGGTICGEIDKGTFPSCDFYIPEAIRFVQQGLDKIHPLAIKRPKPYQSYPFPIMVPEQLFTKEHEKHNIFNFKKGEFKRIMTDNDVYAYIQDLKNNRELQERIKRYEK